MSESRASIVANLGPVIGLSPFECPDAGLVSALARSGALGVLDLGHDLRTARAAIGRLRGARFGVRIPEHVDADAFELPPQVAVVIVPASVGRFDWGGRAVLAQVCTLDDARAAMTAGVDGLVVKGNEAGGMVSDETSFVLMQRVLGATRLPIWVQGGIGLHSGAACVAAGARGIVLDSQLALLEEASTSGALRGALASMDGSETALFAGYRLYARANARKAPPGAQADDIARALGNRDPAEELVALGQDAAFARPFAERFTTVERLVRAFHTAQEGHLRQARALRPLARRASLAQSLGVEFPIAQGPMTRVSDRAAFAEAVAEGGGLPFLALSLMRGPEVRTLLEETRERLGARPWGVGILGFAPQELRDEQLALLSELRPPVAILAGGTPSQLEPLEAAGIRTYLHVPSPALLDLFLGEGARRFVLEGGECGGHVGPRSSFVLWDLAVERLLARARLDDVDVWFAGGIHDALSASMVAMLAAPLAARGARVGVLMGTAYLFTEEAVASGAIRRGFQDEALRCERTALLETAPGHKTRCAFTNYVRSFEEARARLEAEGSDPQAKWAALEQLNLGRLRIAAKGLKRDDTKLVDVGEDEQRDEGLFMIGQIAALRRATCTIRQLHEDVSDGATARLDRATPRSSTRQAHPIDVAIVGMACIYPDAPDAAAFWSNIVLGRTSIREVSPERWNPAIYFDPQGTGDKTPSKWGGFVPPTLFDPGAYGIPPRSLAAIDPVQILALQVARRALDDAGYDDRPFDHERASVVFGAEAGADLASAYDLRANLPQYFGSVPPELDACLPKLTEDSFPGVLSNVIAGRIANRLDLRGVNYTVDAACASSLAAVDVACKELAQGSSDLVIAGGADLHNGIYDYLMFASVHALSPTGRCRPFDAQADGIALGEGVAAVVLKRLVDAERDGDRIYAVLKGVGGSSDGKSLGLTAPRKEGQLRSLERAYERAGISPADVGLVEAHGTGTVVGDKTELATLTEFFGAAGALPGGCTLGSVKAQIGHTKCAAGMAGLIKATFAVHTGVLPATKNVENPNAAYEPTSSPFVLRDAATPWLESDRVAAVSAFGFGGTNFHAVLASYGAPAPSVAFADWPAELFVVRAADERGTKVVLEALSAAATAEVPPKLRDLAAGLRQTNRADPVRLAIVASSLSDLAEKAARAREGDDGDGVYVARPTSGEVAFLFPGQGSQKPGMLRDLFVAFPSLRSLLSLGSEWTDRLFPGGAYTPEQRAAQQTAMNDTRVAQPTLGVVGLAMARLLSQVGVRPAMLGGHSYGELVALCVAGAFDEASLVRLSEARAQCILDAAGDAPGTMAAVQSSAPSVREALSATPDIVIANHNAPDQVVLAGSTESVARACATLADQGIRARPLQVACAFHSPVVAAAREPFARRLADIVIEPLRLPVYANTTALPYGPEPCDVRNTLASQLAEPVRFVEQIEAMYAAGARVFVEAGPGGVLTDLVRRILGDRAHVAIACDPGGGPGLRGFVSALAQLVAAGIEVDTGSLFAGRATAHDLAQTEGFAAPATAWIVDGGGARPLHGELPDFAKRPLAEPIAIPARRGDRESVVRDYLRSMRESVEDQRRVMLAYLGGAEDLPGAALEPASPALVARLAAPSATHEVEVADRASSALETLVHVVSERTGYPINMLDPKLDLEADLGIDSIKRIEILGTVRDRLRLPSNGEVMSGFLDQLASVKTLDAIALLIDERLQRLVGLTTRPPRTIVATPQPAPSTSAPPSIQRYVPELAWVPPAVRSGASIKGRHFAIVPDALGVAAKLADLLNRHGAKARLVSKGEKLGKIAALVHLETLTSDTTPSIRSLFKRAKEATNGSAAEWIVAATGFGGQFGHGAEHQSEAGAAGGVSGLLKSLAKEVPSLRVRTVDLDPKDAPDKLAERLFRELGTDERLFEVGYVGNDRQTLVPTSRPESTPPDVELDIDEHSVVLVTGGARGITGRIALTMAQRFRCTLELIGRSPAPLEPDDAELESATDARAVRAVLAARRASRGAVGVAGIDAECQRILAAREIRATLAAIREAGADVSYHAVDVRDAQAFGGLVDRLRARHGRIDGVVHGAGLVEDKLLSDKTGASFDRVFDTKVVGATVLADKLAADARFFVLFSSVAGTFGSRGQTDYAAANEALDRLAHRLHHQVEGRVLSIGWGPWRGVGMVRPELEREYERRGVSLIAPEAGIERFFDELLRGSDPHVLLTAASAEVLT